MDSQHVDFAPVGRYEGLTRYSLTTALYRARLTDSSLSLMESNSSRLSKIMIVSMHIWHDNFLENRSTHHILASFSLSNAMVTRRDPYAGDDENSARISDRS